MGPEVEKDQTLRRLWFEGGEGIEHDQITPFRMRLISAYIDWRDFKIVPWKKGLEANQIPEFWKRVLRNFRHLESDAQEYRRQKEAMKRKKPGGIGQQRPRDVQVTDGGVAPTEEATQDYKAYRQKKIALQHRQRQQRHQQLQARQAQQQQYQQRQARARPRQRRR